MRKSIGRLPPTVPFPAPCRQDLAATTVSARELAFRQRLDESARRLAYGHLVGVLHQFRGGGRHERDGSWSGDGCATRVAVVAAVALALAAALAPTAVAQTQPVFVNGQAQVVPAFNVSAQWVRHRLWVETEFDSDGDGKRDRMHVDVTRPAQTDSENLKVPVIYETSPYYAGTASTNSQYFWNTNHEVGAPPPARISPPPIAFNPNRTSISTSEVNTWVPRGFAVVHSESPGSGLSQGCPTVGGTNENDGPKAVVDWLNGRAKGYTTIDGTTEVRPTGRRARSA